MELARIDELDDNGDQQREVYARFGLAVYMAQVFEAGVSNLIVVAEGVEGRLTSRQEVDRRFDELYRQVLGRLVRVLEQDQRIDEKDLSVCRRALDERNRLMHHYWREQITSMATPAGRQRMVDELDAARELFQQADGIC